MCGHFFWIVWAITESVLWGPAEALINVEKASTGLLIFTKIIFMIITNGTIILLFQLSCAVPSKSFISITVFVDFLAKLHHEFWAIRQAPYVWSRINCKPRVAT